MEETLSFLSVKAMLSAMLRGDGKEFGAYFQEFISNSMSYYDISHALPENSYHMFVLGLLMLLHPDYEIKSNRESGFGRYDIMIIPREKEKPGIIIEFKKCEAKETLEQAAARGLERLRSRIPLSRNSQPRGLWHCLSRKRSFFTKCTALISIVIVLEQDVLAYVNIHINQFMKDSLEKSLKELEEKLDEEAYDRGKEEIKAHGTISIEEMDKRLGFNV